MGGSPNIVNSLPDRPIWDQSRPDPPNSSENQQPYPRYQMPKSTPSDKDAANTAFSINSSAPLSAVPQPAANGQHGGSSPLPQHTQDPSSSSKHDRWQQAKARVFAFVITNFMLISFSLAAALAMAWPLPGKVVASWAVGDVRIVQAINNFMVFLISGLTLKSDDFR